ncbi:NUDIX domain-containing protein [Planosporangium sp. 12N6]|uniref:NUDIX domain-containing protein n=1 Tax=Planosporangium spinosum TaxID=3402278 RepID=UPI003CEDCD3B
MTAPEPPPMARPRVAAGALFTDDAGRVLLVRPTYKDYWEIPGGYVEPGESPRIACLRELREELSISPPVGRHLVVDWAPAEGEGDKLLFIFDCGTLPPGSLADVRLQQEELSDLRFVPPTELDRYVPGRLLRRLHTALNAKRDGQAAYAEHGDSRF